MTLEFQEPEGNLGIHIARLRLEANVKTGEIIATVPVSETEGILLNPDGTIQESDKIPDIQKEEP